MKHKTKKILVSSVVVLSLTAIIIWYFFPILIAKWFMFDHKVNKSFEIVPHLIERLPMPPTDWGNISIGALKLRLPISEYNKIYGKGQYINFISDRGSLLIFDLDPSVKLMNYEERLAIFKALPRDISFFSSRNKNEKYSTNLILKTISLPHGGEVDFINSEKLKAICIISEKDEKGFSAIATLYSPNEAMAFSIMFTRYMDITALKTDLLNILAGIIMPDQPLEAEKVGNDINTIIKKYNRT
jgi:hypothetical protein